MSDSLQPHWLWHARFLCFPLSPGVCSNSCPLSQRCYLTISSSASPFSFCLQSFPATGSFPMSQFFASGGQNIGVFSFSMSPTIEYSGLISFRIDRLDPCCPRDSQETSPAPQLEGISSSMLSLISLEKEMATHSSILAWKIPWTEEPHGLQFMGSQRVRHDLAIEQQFKL